MLNSNETSVSLRTSHGLRGPLINIQGFSGEIASVVERMCALLDQHEASLPPEYRADLAGLINDDLKPCLGYLDTGIALLEDRIRKLKTLGDMDYGAEPSSG